MTVELLCGQDNLHRGGVVGGGNGVIKEADGSDDFASGLESIVGGVGGVAEDDWGLSGLFTASNSCDLSVGIEEDLIDLLVEHESATMDSAES